MFDRLKKLNVSEKTSMYPLPPQVGPDAYLIVKFAGQENKPYFNEMLKRAARRVRGRSVEAALGTVDVQRQDDRELYPLHVIVGWGGLPDDQGSLVDYSLEGCRQLCQQMPDWMMDGLRAHCANVSSFLEPGEEPIDAKALAGNSGSGSAGS